MKNIPKSLAITSLSLIISVLAGCNAEETHNTDTTSAQKSTQLNNSESTQIVDVNENACNNKLIVDTYKNQQSDTQVLGCGTIVKVLADDVKGSQHQRLIIKLDNINLNSNEIEKTKNMSILIAHNIDLAPRAANVKEGTKITFHGEYEYNEKGGVVHWTHHDPAGRHQDGWLEVKGKRFG